MTAQQLYELALKHINGSGGYPKNPKKGEKTMLEASNAGSKEASAFYAMNYAKNDSEKLIHLQKNGAYTEYPNEYVRCLFTTSQKIAKKNPELVKKNLSSARGVKVHADGYYYLAELAKLAGESDGSYRDYLYLASLGMSKAMPDETYKYINRERGVVYDKEEIELYVKANDIKVGGYGVVTKTEEEAWSIVEANLDTKEGKAKLPAGAAGIMLRKRPQGVLEYQRVIYSRYKTSLVSVGFEYDNPKFSTVTTGTLSDYKVSDSQLTSAFWYTDFRYPEKQSTAWKSLKEISFTSTVPTKGRFRVGTPYYYSLCNKCMDSAKDGSKWRAKEDVKDYLSKQKNWNTAHIKINLQKSDTKLDEFHIKFVPFYYFTVDLAFGKTATVRVNAQTGAVDFYENCPFGQFTEYDDYETGGNVQLNKDVVDAAKKAAAKKSIAKDKKIGKYCFIGAVVAFILVFVFEATVKNDFLEILAFLSSGGLAIAGVWFFFKSFFKGIINKFKK